jgi:hypothetical protein
MLLAVFKKLPPVGNRFPESIDNKFICIWEFRLHMLRIEELEMRRVDGGGFQESIMRSRGFG